MLPGSPFSVQLLPLEWLCSMFYYLFAWAGVIINAIAVVQAHNLKISLVGPILGVIGNTLYGFTAALAIPAVIINTTCSYY